MKKTILTLTLLALTSMHAYSDDTDSELTEASSDEVMSYLMQCKNDAIEDEISTSEMKNYLLTCINDELDGNYYKQIKALPKE